MNFPDTFLYSISWEDLEIDKKHLELKETDNILTITGGGDNAFDLLLAGGNVYCVDANPAQTHLMELKMKTIEHGSYEALWSMFGEGKMNNFKEHMRSVLHASNNATKAFWVRNAHYFDSSVYFHGGFGTLVYIFGVLGLRYVLHIKSRTLFELCIRMIQAMVYTFLFLFSDTDIMWRIYGTPRTQLNMIAGDKRSLYSYVWKHTIEPVIRHTDILNDNHFYYLMLHGKFTQDNCPNYLKQYNHTILKNKIQNLENINDTFIKVLQQRTYDKVILMDHLDWNDKEYVEELCTSLKESLNDSGRAILRSAALHPWYLDTFEGFDFKITNVSNHFDNDLSDRVNMYASCWLVQKNL